ncbi:hypothetical protein JHK82_027663 [Glycine max]|nr:hypothetical protein JHK82_027663 [Glycine max]
METSTTQARQLKNTQLPRYHRATLPYNSKATRGSLLDPHGIPNDKITSVTVPTRGDITNGLVNWFQMTGLGTSPIDCYTSGKGKILETKTTARVTAMRLSTIASESCEGEDVASEHGESKSGLKGEPALCCVVSCHRRFVLGQKHSLSMSYSKSIKGRKLFHNHKDINSSTTRARTTT